MIDGSTSIEFRSRGGDKHKCVAAGGAYDTIQEKCVNYGNEVAFINDMMQSFEKEGSLESAGVQVAAAVFSAKPTDFFGLGDFNSASQMRNGTSFEFPTGKTYTMDAVQRCYDHLTNNGDYNSAREDSTKLIVLMTVLLLCTFL